MRNLDLTDPTPLPGRDGETILLLIEHVPEGAEDWGVLESLRGTSWESGVREISGEAFSHALHGRFLPLLQELGRDPRASARRVSLDEGECRLKDMCIGWEKTFCHPGGHKGKGHRRKEGPPECYEPPLSQDTPAEVLEVFQRVSWAWKEGRHVVVVQGDGFNLG